MGGCLPCLGSSKGGERTEEKKEFPKEGPASSDAAGASLGEFPAASSQLFPAASGFDALVRGFWVFWRLVYEVGVNWRFF